MTIEQQIEEIEIEETALIARPTLVKKKKYKTFDGMVYNTQGEAKRHLYELEEKELLSSYPTVKDQDDEDWYFIKNQEEWDKIVKFYREEANFGLYFNPPAFVKFWYEPSNHSSRNYFNVRYIDTDMIKTFFKIYKENVEEEE